jgi:hypothetical protein
VAEDDVPGLNWRARFVAGDDLAIDQQDLTGMWLAAEITEG